jgi:formate dehydrogenase iron-sulfur subunit
VILERLIHGNAGALAAYQASGGYRALEAALQSTPSGVVEALEEAALRGRGGAGYPTGRKWKSVASQNSSQKYVVANADEGDPGAYVDRFLMEGDPHALIEGMLIAAHAVGATRGWIYLRSEYPAAGVRLEAAIKEAQEAGLLGGHCLGRGRPFDLEVYTGGGSYVCGEETALLRSLEGVRPEVMTRPPYASESGLHGRPTLVNNVETLAAVPWIIRNGSDAYKRMGFSGSRGTKVVSLNSLFRRPGLYEVEFGTTIRHVVEELGGGLVEGSSLQGVIVGGPLAGIVPPRLMDTRLGFEEMRNIGCSVGHGGVIAFDQHTSILELLHHVFAFGAFESCGKCTPCRVGSRQVERALAGLLRQPASSPWNAALHREALEALHWTSLCGLGTGLAEFANSVLRHYGKEFDACLR